MDANNHSHNEIIIVRRSLNDHDEHHGGVWKIAFADFMTAMMAFFLVMWLINASNEETKKAVASYFNPIKLMDRTSNPKGVRSPKYGSNTNVKDEPENTSTVVTGPSNTIVRKEGVAETFEEKALFTDPYALLAEIAAGINTQENGTDKVVSRDAQRSVGMGLSGGIAFQDPFDPSAWNLNFSAREDKANNPELADKNTAMANQQIQKSDDNIKDNEVIKEGEKYKAGIKPDDKPETAEEKEDAKNKEIVDGIRKATLRVLNSSGVEAPKVEIQLQDKGVLVTLSDYSKTGMFNVGSARPTAELVRIMSGIGKILSKQEGQVTIAGHTDGRKYRSKHYDNWRLSTARAHMAYYMLVNGGLQEERVEKIEGYAAGKLVKPDEPYAAVNRRIELYLSLQ